MIAIQEAVQRAADFCKQIYPEAQDILLEEVEREEEKFWLITISFLIQATRRDGGGFPGMAAAMEQMLPRLERRYKSLKVDGQTGEVVSMKIRELQS